MPIKITSINKTYVSTLDPIMDKRDIDGRVMDLYKENEFSDILNTAGNKMPVTQEFYSSFVNTDIFVTGVVTSATNSGTQLVTAVLSAGTSGGVRVNETALLADGNTCIVESVSNSGGVDTLVLRSVAGINITIAASDKLRFFATMAGESSAAPQSVSTGYVKYSNRWGIHVESSRVTDVEKNNRIEATINGEDVFMVKDHLDKRMKLKAAINISSWVQDMSTTKFSDANPILTDKRVVGDGGGGAIQTSRGINKYIDAYGVKLSAVGSGNSGSPVPNGSISIADFNNFCDAAVAGRFETDQNVYGGSKVRRGFDNFIKGLPSSGALNSVRLIVAGKELDTTVDKFGYGGFNFHFVTLPVLNHSMVADTLVGKSAYFLPKDGMANLYGGGKAPAIRTRYVVQRGELGDEMILESHDGANAPRPTGTTAHFLCKWETKQGIEFLTPSQSARMQVVG